MVALRVRARATARHLTDFLEETDRFAKTIVCCVNQEHALEMRYALATPNADLVEDHPDYLCRVTADEGDIGSAHLGHPIPIASTISRSATDSVKLSDHPQVIRRGSCP